MSVERLRSGRVAESIRLATEALPPVLAGRLGVGHFEGDPHFAGFFPHVSRARWNHYNGDPEAPYPARATRAIQTDFRWLPRSDRRATVIHYSRSRSRPGIVLHELGHAAHRWAADRGIALPRLAAAFTDLPHAEGNYHECYAEAFVAWLLPQWAMDWARGGPGFDYRYCQAWRTFYQAARGEDNRGVLAHFNALADRPWDAPPPSADGTVGR